MIGAGQAPFGTIEMDELDRRIMRLLRPNVRRSYASIARVVGVSEPTVRNRVDRMIKMNRVYARGVGARLEGIAYTETWHILRAAKTNFECEGENVGRESFEEEE